MKLKLNSLNPKYLNTWNQDINQKIRILIVIIYEKFENLLNNKWDIDVEKITQIWIDLDLMSYALDISSKKVSCNKVKEKLIQNNSWEDIMNTLNDVKRFFQNNLVLNMWIKKLNNYQETINFIDKNFPDGINLSIFSLNSILSNCSNLEECEYVLSKFKGLIELNIITINRILSCCSNFKECEHFLDKHKKSVELDTYSINTILSKCCSLFEHKKTMLNYSNWVELNWLSYYYNLVFLLSEENITIPKIKEEISVVLKLLNTCKLSSRTKEALKNNVLYKPNNYKNYIISIIRKEKLENLQFVVEKHNRLQK